MTLEQAKALRAALDAGIAEAERTGSDEVRLTSALQQMDDAARAVLQAAIDAGNGS